MVFFRCYGLGLLWPWVAMALGWPCDVTCLEKTCFVTFTMKRINTLIGVSPRNNLCVSVRVPVYACCIIRYVYVCVYVHYVHDHVHVYVDIYADAHAYLCVYAFMYMHTHMHM